MPLKTLRVRRKGTAMVPHYESNVRKFVGFRHSASAGEEFTDFATKEKKMQGGFLHLDDVVEVQNLVEYRRHIAVDKDLWAADQATADECGVAFDPTFGGEDTKPTADAVEEH